MTSQKQRNANQSNARKSTGPKTEAGKAMSRRNAYRHGLAAEVVIIGDENPTDFENLRAGLVSYFKPECELARVLVDQLANQFWRLRRVPMLEAAIFEAISAAIVLPIKLDPAEAAAKEDARIQKIIDNSERYLPKRHGQAPDPDAQQQARETASEEPAAKAEPPKDERARDLRAIIGLALIQDSQRYDALGKLARYEVRLTNGVMKTLRMLRQLQLLPVSSDPLSQDDFELGSFGKTAS